MQSPIAWWPDNALPTPRDPVPSGNHKGALLEHCARHKRPTSNFVTTRSGPSHAPHIYLHDFHEISRHLENGHLGHQEGRRGGGSAEILQHLTSATA